MRQQFKALVFVATLALGPLGHAATATIDSNTTNQYIRGFGVSSAWCNSGTIAPAAQALWADDNVDGHAGLSILRTRIDPGGNFAAEAGPMTQAKGINPNILIWSTEWTPPAALKNNNNVNGPGANNTFNNTPANSTTYANYLVNYIKTIKNNYGIDLYCVSPQNEPDWNTSYESCVWNATQFNDFVKNYFYPALQSNSLPTKVMIPESFADNLALAATAMNDAVTAPMISIIGNHLYGLNGNPPRTLASGGWAHLTNQESWETEMSDVSGAPHDAGMGAALQIAGWMHSCMVAGNMNAYLHWWIYAYGGSNEGLFGTDCNTPTRKLGAMGNFSKFVRPGWYRMGGTINSGTTGVNISAYKNAVGAPGKYTIVAINTTGAAVNQTFNFSNFNSTSCTPWITDSSRNLAKQGSIAIAGNTFTYSLPAQSLVSFVGYTGSMGTPTPTPTYPGTPTRTPTASPTPQSQLFDDFEDLNNADNWGGNWSVFAGTGSAVTITVGSGGGAPGSTLGRGVITGNITDYGGITGSFSGSPRNLSSYVGITFMVKGSGTMWFQMPQTSITDGDNFGALFTATAAWTQVTIPFSSLTQRGFGAVTTLNLSQITMFQWASNTTGAMSYEIDDVKLLTYNPPTNTPSPTRTRTPTPISSPTYTSSNTPLPSASPSATASRTATASPSLTSSRTATPSMTRTATPVSTATFTSSATPSNTTVSSPSNTPSLTTTRTSTTVSSPSNTPTLSMTRTSTPLSSPSNSPSVTSSSTPVSSPSDTRTVTPISTFSSTRTSTPLTSPTDSPSITPVFTATVTRTSTPLSSPTVTLSTSPTSSATPIASATSTPSNTPLSSPSPTRTGTPSSTASPSSSGTPTQTPINTGTPSRTVNPTLTRTPSSTATSTVSPPSTATSSPTTSPTPTATTQSTGTATWTPTVALPTATAVPGNDHLVIYPNPIRGPFVTLYPPYFTGNTDISVTIYTASYARVEYLSFPNSTWHPLVIPLQERWGGRLPQGLYYVVLKTSSARYVAKMFVLN